MRSDCSPAALPGSCWPAALGQQPVDERDISEALVEEVDVGRERKAGVAVAEPHLHPLRVLA